MGTVFALEPCPRTLLSRFARPRCDRLRGHGPSPQDANASGLEAHHCRSELLQPTKATPKADFVRVPVALRDGRSARTYPPPRDGRQNLPEAHFSRTWRPKIRLNHLFGEPLAVPGGTGHFDDRPASSGLRSGGRRSPEASHEDILDKKGELMRPLKLIFSLLASLALAFTGSRSHAQTFSTLASFDGPDGDSPRDNVTVSADGKTLYGTTVEGGASLGGTVFSLPSTGGTPTNVFQFPSDGGTFPNGAGPFGGVTLSADGSTLYGMANQGGAEGSGPNGTGYGTVYSVPVAGGAAHDPAHLQRHKRLGSQRQFDACRINTLWDDPRRERLRQHFQHSGGRRQSDESAHL